MNLYHLSELIVYVNDTPVREVFAIYTDHVLCLQRDSSGAAIVNNGELVMTKLHGHITIGIRE